MPTSRPNLPLDVPRSTLLEFTSRVISEAWSSFDSARVTETPITANLLELARLPLGEHSTPALQALEEAAAALDASLAQSRPRFFAFVGSSGLEVGVLGDALASCFDVNLAVTARAADLIEAQSLEWVAQLLGYPFAGGTVTSGGMVSNLTALMAARERAIPGVRHTGFSGRRVAMYCSVEAHYSVRRAAEILGIGADWVRSLPLDANRRMRPDDLARAIDADIAAPQETFSSICQLQHDYLQPWFPC